MFAPIFNSFLRVFDQFTSSTTSFTLFPFVYSHLRHTNLHVSEFTFSRILSFPFISRFSTSVSQKFSKLPVKQPALKTHRKRPVSAKAIPPQHVLQRDKQPASASSLNFHQTVAPIFRPSAPRRPPFFRGKSNFPKTSGR